MAQIISVYNFPFSLLLLFVWFLFYTFYGTAVIRPFLWWHQESFKNNKDIKAIIQWKGYCSIKKNQQSGWRYLTHKKRYRCFCFGSILLLFFWVIFVMKTFKRIFSSCWYHLLRLWQPQIYLAKSYQLTGFVY